MTKENELESQAIEITKYGPAHGLTFKNNQVKANLAEDEVNIEVAYSGVNFADIVMRLGMYQDAPPKPFTPGYEISGIVKEVGVKVTKFKIGDKVMAGTRFGGYTSNIILPEWQVLSLSDELTLEEGAAIPVNFITAYIALHEFGRIRSGDKILIECATGGVGVYCMGLAKKAGATVIGLTSSPAKKEFIESLGATAYTHEEFAKSDEKDFDFILNSTGGKSIKDQYNRLGMSGKLTCIGLQQAIQNGNANIFAKLKAVLQTPWYPLLKLVMQSKSVSGFNALKYFDDDDWMQKNLHRVEETRIKPVIGGVFDSKKAGDAHSFLEQKKAKGKVLIKWEH